jgi:hypothetical protein
MESHEFDWYTGRVVQWDLGRVTPTKLINEQYGELHEDLAQVAFGANTILDVGWYPELSPAGRFVIFVVRNQEWDEPVLRLECKDIAGLYAAIRSAIDVARG